MHCFASVEELLVNTGTGRRPSLLEEYKPYLHRRWNEARAPRGVCARTVSTITDDFSPGQRWRK
ncbi:hypothetical protein AB0E01_44535 [Nocardia vinacea]|uniref:hypothetical protein n=1 Tax=Nocardia vinacea TaxID=96468 RepID=UPI0033F3C7A9